MTNPEILEWIRTAPGVAMNPDGAYGLQCVDLADQYAMDLFGVPWQQSVGGVTGAKQILDSASDAYWVRTNNDPNNPNQVPKTGDVIVWGGSPANQWGHVAVVVSADVNGIDVIQQDGFAPPLQWYGGYQYSAKPAHRARLPYYGPGTGLVSGWLTPRANKIKGYKAPVAPVASTPTLAPTQRVAASVVNYRPEPNTNKKETKKFQPGDVLNFVGFVRGAVPAGGDSNIWFKGTGGGYIHSSGVIGGANVTGLKDLTPAPVAPPKPAPVTNPAARTIGSKPANQRTAPKTSASISTSLEPGFTFIAKGYVHGDIPKGGNSDIWFVGSASGGYVHSSACTDGSTNGLKDLTPPPAPVVTPPVYVPPVVKPAPVTPPVVVTPEPVVPTLVAEFACVTEVSPAHPDNFQVGNFPEKPTSWVPHQFGVKGTKIGSVKSWFGMSLEDRKALDPDAGQSSAHFSVEDDMIVQHVSIKNRAYHAGPNANFYIGIETSPNQSAKTIASVRKLVRELNDYYGYELIVAPRHKDIPGNATECGKDINLADYQNIGLTPKTSDNPSEAVILGKAKELLIKLIERL